MFDVAPHVVPWAECGFELEQFVSFVRYSDAECPPDVFAVGRPKVWRRFWEVRPEVQG